MISATRKRVFILLCVIAVTCLIVRLVLFNGSLLAHSNLHPLQAEDFRHAPGAPVVVRVFYEALCPDSKHFIMKQLVPTQQTAAPLIEVVLVPYGKATTSTNADGTFRFDCQHGLVECQANTYHACAIEAIKDSNARLNMISCMIKDNRVPKEAMRRCAKQHNIDSMDLIQKCFDSSHGSELLKLNGDATHALRPPVSFIPTITLDGAQGRQAAILKNLLAEVCKIARGTEQADEICKNI